MEAARVDHIMVSGIPFIKKWSENEPFMRPRYYLDSSSIVKRARDTDIAVASAILDYQRNMLMILPAPGTRQDTSVYHGL